MAKARALTISSDIGDERLRLEPYSNEFGSIGL